LYTPAGLVSPLTTVLLEKPTNPQSGKKFPTLYGISLGCSQELHTSPYPQPGISCPCPPIPYFVTPILIISSHLCLVLQMVSFLEVSPPESHIHSSSSPHLTHPVYLIQSSR